jgi:zinc protease
MTVLRTWPGVVLLVLLAPGLPAQGPPRPVASVEGVTAYRFENGLRLLLVPERSRPMVTVSVTYFVGSRHEGYGESGMAHLLEHLLFKGTAAHPEIPAELSARGAAPNGITSADRTIYHETFPAGEANLRWALDLESDRMVNSGFDAADLAAELPVVLNEFAAGENSAVNILRQRVMAVAFPWHNYGRPAIGTPTDVRGTSLERLRAFYRRYYQPDNAMVVVAGDFDPTLALAIAQQTFGAVPRPDRTGANRLWDTHTREPAQDGERGVALRRPADAEAVILGWHVPGAAHPDMAAVEVLAHVLGAPGTGRLFLSVLGPRIGANITAYVPRLREPGMLFAQAVLRQGDPAESARDALFTAIGRLESSQPPTVAEVERGKTALLNAMAEEMLDLPRFAARLGEWQAMGDWRLLIVHRDRIRAVAAGDVARVAASYVRPGNMTVGILKPSAAGQAVELPRVGEVAPVVDGYLGDDAVVGGEPLDPDPAALEARTRRMTLPNGVRLALLPRHTRGATVTARFAFPFGSAGSLEGHRATSVLAGQLLMRGTVAQDRRELSDSIARLQARIAVGGNVTGAYGSVAARRGEFPAALRLAFDILRRPRLDPNEFLVLRQAQLAAIDQQRNDPQAVATRTLQRLLSPWPPAHPLHLPPIEGWRDEIAAVTLEDVRRFHDRFYGASQGEIAVVGDFDPDSVHALVLAELSGWESLAPYQPVEHPATAARLPGDTTISVPERANAFLAVGRSLDIDLDDPDHAPLTLATYLLGGGFLNSRLADRLRHREGLSYGVQSTLTLDERVGSGTWRTFVIHEPEHLARVEAALREELERAGREGFTTAEVEAAQQGWLASRRLARADDAALVGRLLWQEATGRRWADEAALERRVVAVEPRALREVVARYLGPEALSVVRVGAYPGHASP